MDSQFSLLTVADEISHEVALLHQKLGRAQDLMSRHPDEMDSKAHLSDLLSSMREHFQYEEQAMRMMAPQLRLGSVYAEHTAAHAALMERIADALRPDQDHAQLSAVAALIESWINEHIQQHDQFLLVCLGVGYP